MKFLPSVTCVHVCALTTGIALASVAAGQWTPDWVSTVPVGSALTAGLQAMTTDANGVTYITGIGGSSSNTDVYTAAFGPDGTERWLHVFNGGADWHDQARGLCLSPSGVVYVTGNTPGPGSYSNVLLLAYDAPSGTLLNTVQHSSGTFTSEHGATVCADAIGNVYVGGGTVGDGADGLLTSFDVQGQLRWSTTYDGPAWGPYSQDHVRQVAIDPGGDVIAMIHGVMNSLHPDYVIIKYRPTDGTIIWQTNWGVSGGDFVKDMAIDANGDIYVTGTGIDFIDKFSTIKVRGADGQLIWQAYDALAFRNAGRAIVLDHAGGVYITGSSDPDGDQSNSNDDFYTVKRDADTGALQWTHSYGESCVGCFDGPSDVIVDTAGNVFVTGSTSSPPYSGDMVVFRLDAATGVETDRSIVDGGGPSFHAGGSILDMDASENLYVGGGFTNYDTGAEDMAAFGYASLVDGPHAPGDANDDGRVDFADVLAVIAEWGPCPTPPAECAADVDGNGDVGFSDVTMVLAHWHGS